MLAAARTLGDRLVVVLSHDRHNKKPNAVPAAQRLKRLKALDLADKIVIGAPDSFAESIRREMPDIIALGYDQRLPDEETERLVRDLGIKVARLPWFPGKYEA
jgi:glycerol-3-phosphate cytidylyltransferase-like family protein